LQKFVSLSTRNDYLSLAERDILMLDNMLTAHGRNPYSGPEKF
jgi:hypothetical protein